MALPVWGNLEKSQVDAETIEEAIARLIQAHEDDPNAHVEVGESLQSHKAAAIIDHLIASIIADKIKDEEITRPKLSPDSIVFNSGKFDRGLIMDLVRATIQETGAGSFDTSIRGSEALAEGEPALARAYFPVFPFKAMDFWANNFSIGWDIYLEKDTGLVGEGNPGGIIYLTLGDATAFGTGPANANVVGFRFTENADSKSDIACFVRVKDDALYLTTIAEKIETNARYIFEIRKRGNVITFYINDVLVHTVTKTLAGASLGVVQFGGITDGADSAFYAVQYQFSYLFYTL